jgi:hypothetical protein
VVRHRISSRWKGLEVSSVPLTVEPPAGADSVRFVLADETFKLVEMSEAVPPALSPL